MSLTYVLGIYISKYYMQRVDKRIELRIPLILWNLALAGFSILGSVRMSPEFFHVLSEHGFEYSMCNASFAAGVSGFWTEMFAYSKVAEHSGMALLLAQHYTLHTSKFCPEFLGTELHIFRWLNSVILCS